MRDNPIFAWLPPLNPSPPVQMKEQMNERSQIYHCRHATTSLKLQKYFILLPALLCIFNFLLLDFTFWKQFSLKGLRRVEEAV